MRWFWLVAFFAACGDTSSAAPDGSGGDAAPAADAGPDAAPDGATTSGNLGQVTGEMNLATCPMGAPAGSMCKQVTVSGCPSIETESIDATVAILAQTGTLKGTIVHFSGSGGQGFQTLGTQQYAGAGYQQVFVAWRADWEQTQSLGIKAAGCRPSTILKWIFDSVHNGSRALAFCGEGFSGGSGQLGYALAQYGMGDYLDYVNELSGPPFARIDLGCDGNQPATAMVCNATDTMRLPASLNRWENVQAPDSCGSTTNSAATIAKWHDDSIAVGGVYVYPKTQVEFFDCTNNATAVTAMAQIYFNLIQQSGSTTTHYHCYSQADGCNGEGLGTGNQAAAAAMISGCVPHHQ
jgi:hypothetical protein